MRTAQHCCQDGMNECRLDIHTQKHPTQSKHYICSAVVDVYILMLWLMSYNDHYLASDAMTTSLIMGKTLFSSELEEFILWYIWGRYKGKENGLQGPTGLY